jgi:alpha-ketoglutarate-dependent 2,4-dichlorophenoxyacetate dioxygenase
MLVTPIHDDFVGVVEGLHIDGAVSSDVVDALQDALDTFAVLVLPNTRLTNEDFIAFGRCFGELENFGSAYGRASQELTVRITNLNERDRIRPADDPYRTSTDADALWHTDSSYRSMRARYSMLLARRLPDVGGETQFCNTRGAYDALPQSMKEKVDDLIALHSIIYSRGLVGFTAWTDQQRTNLPPIPQPFVFQNPRTRRRSLYLASHIFEIKGWSKEESRELVRQLTEFATQPRFVHAHKWRLDDLVVWDNRATMHRRAPYDDLNEARELTALRVVEPSELYVQRT